MSAITPEQWQKVKPIFHAALDRPASARTAYLDEACAGDAALRAEIEALLAAHEDTRDFLSQPAAAEAVPHLFNETIELPAGQKLGGYEIQRKLGVGGMGEVYLARDSRLGRSVALKILPASLTREADRVRRFQQEARAASALNHPNILTIYEVGEADGVHFIATEYIEGVTLRTLLRHGELTLGEVLDIVIQAGQALEASHRTGIIHRDIKPENLMRRVDGFVKVLDFGLAKLRRNEGGGHRRDEGGGMRDESEKETLIHPSSLRLHPSTLPGIVMGTVSYMSPEQARGHDVDARSDVFSLGVVLYEMLTGRVPFDGESTSDVIAALLALKPEPLDSYISGLPATFQRIVDHALQKRREDRYASVSEMLTDLRALKDDLEITAKLKRSGKAKIADTSLLEMRVGHSQGQLMHATNERRKRSTSTMHTLAAWFSRFSFSWKLVAVPVLVLIGLAVAMGWQWMKQQQSALPAISSVAVLPFADNTNDAQLAYLPDGLTESLISSLSQLPELKVMARSTVFNYKGKEVDPRTVGAALKVNAVVQGRVARQGEQLTINVELADTVTGARLWGKDYKRSLKDLAAVQAELMQTVSDQLAQRSGAPKPAGTVQPSTQNAEALRLYLLGRYHANRQTREDGAKAQAYYQQAVALDPNYALAYSGLASYYAFASSRYFVPQEAMPQARQFALKALELNQNLAEAHYALALVKSWGDWDWAGAEQEFRKALALNPSLADAHTIYANQLSMQRRFAEFHHEIQLAQQLDPLSAIALEMSVWGLYLEGRYDEALAECRRLQSLDPAYYRAYMHLGFIYRQKGQLQQALAEVERGMPQQHPETLLVTQAYLHAVAGDPAKARKQLAALEQISRQQHWLSPYLFAKIYVGLGEHERAIACLEETYAAHSEFLMSIGIDPVFAPLRAVPRFNELVRKVGL